jgi:hypothetical protein
VLTDGARFESWLDASRAQRLRTALIARAARWAAAVAPDDALVAGTGLDCLLEGTGARALETGGGPEEAAALAARDGEALLVVRAENPWLAPWHAQGALNDLAAGCDVTLGPATNGSWYLLGMARLRPGLLSAGAAERIATLLREGLAVGMLRAERPLTGPADMEALLADPIAPPELLSAVESERQ